MSARLQLEKRAILLQKVAYALLTRPHFKLSNLENLIGDPSLFDKDMTTILSMLFSHNNLVSDSLPITEQPYSILDQLRSSLESRGFKLPTFRRRFDAVKKMSGGSFRNNENEFAGGEVNALDKPLRRLIEKMYDIRLQNEGHEVDNLGRITTQNMGSQLVQLAESLVTVVKKVVTEGKPYQVNDNSVRVDSGRTPELDARYDQVAAMFNTSLDTSAQGPEIKILSINPGDVIKDDRWYVVGYYLPEVTEAVQRVVPDWDFSDGSPNILMEKASNIVGDPAPLKINLSFEGTGKSPEEIENILTILRNKVKDGFDFTVEGSKASLTSIKQGLLEQVSRVLEASHKASVGLLQRTKAAEQRTAELKALYDFSPDLDENSDEDSIVRLVRLPFAPDQIDDQLPSVELREESYIGKHLSLLKLEMILRTRFSGFVEFDDKYRMIILWANAPGDDVKDADGLSFSEHLSAILRGHVSAFTAALGQKPEVMRTKTGVALYFPKPSSLVRVIKYRNEIERAITSANDDISNMEHNTSLNRKFNRSIDDDELPSYLEETG